MNKHQLGVAPQTLYDTYVAPTRFLEMIPGESLDRTNTILQGQGMAPSALYRRGARRVLERSEGAGNVQFEVATTQFGLLFEHMLGAVATSQPGTVAYEHIFTPGPLSSDAGGPGALTVQKGVEQTNSTVQPFSFIGSMVTDWTMAVSVDEYLTLDLGVDAREVVTSEALAAGTYPALELLHWALGDILVQGSSVACVTDFTLAGSNNLRTDRICLGGGGLKSQPYENDFREITGTITADFANLTDFYDLFAADTSATIKLTFTGTDIEPTFPNLLIIDLFDVRFEGEVPKVTGPEPSMQNVPFTAWVDASGQSIQFTYQTADATP